MTDTQKPALAPYYYRDNFLHLLATVEAQYGDLLSADEQELLAGFHGLGFHAQCLYIRLVMRTGPWFRADKLHYPELGDPQPLLDELLLRNMAGIGTALSAQELGKLYTRRELLLAFPPLAAGQPGDKASLLQAIALLQPDCSLATATLLALHDTRLIAPKGGALLQLLQLLFFGNRHQSLTDFVLADLGLTRYYPYSLDRSDRRFPERAAIEEYQVCAQLGERQHAASEEGTAADLLALAAELLAADIRHPSSENLWYRLCNRLARELERLQEWTAALALYRRSERHPARERRARILERQGDWAAALKLCDEIVASPWCEEELEAATRIGHRAQRQLDGSKTPRRRDNFASINLRLRPASGSVEQRSAAQLQEHWHQVHYVENTLMNTLFGLAFWEQIFAPLPGVFHNPFQSIPTDMYDGTFHQRRQHAIDTRLQQLSGGNLGPLLGEAYQRYRDYACRWVDWRYIDAALVATATTIIPDQHLIAIWERMLFDPRENRRGFPDLVAFGKEEGDYCLIEVKGPGDALQDNQKRWLRFFAAQQIPAQVAWVEWADD